MSIPVVITFANETLNFEVVKDNLDDETFVYVCQDLIDNDAFPYNEGERFDHSWVITSRVG
eukprot:5340555-Amphidinium_carterae.1